MKKYLLAVIFIIAVAAGELAVEAEWERWKLEHGRHYRSLETEAARRTVWMKNKKYIAEHNSRAKEHGYTLEINKFGDLTHEEYISYYLNDNLKEKHRIGRHEPASFIDEEMGYPSSMDWRKQGMVTAVRNQGLCSASYAFAAVGALEAASAIAGNPVTMLSEQNIIDCSVPYGNVGCNGGDIVRALKFVIASGGIYTEASYPYVEHQYLCEEKNGTTRARASGIVVMTSGSEAALVAAVATAGPVAVTIDASSFDFMFYEGGIFSGCSNTTLNHSLLVIGYGTYNGKDYWLLKNSWGTNWGINGYVMIAKNKNNHCGIASYAAYPTV